jgi:predicted transcriptional regulator
MDDRDLEAIPVADAGKIIGVVRSVDILGEIARSIR